MGRGRAKAKQTKVARELKYSSPRMDLDALQREIGSGTAVHDGEAQDEYDGYLGPLLHPLHSGDSVEAVSAYLVSVLEGMGISSSPDVERHFAETLVAWWANANATTE